MSVSLLAALADPAVAHMLPHAVTGACALTAIATPLGFAGALALWRATPALRTAAAVLAVLVLLLPAAFYKAVDLTPISIDRDAWALAGVLARGAAVAGLIAAIGLRLVPPRLRQAAILAGARPMQAWRHAVLAPLLPYFACAAAAVLAVALAEGPAVALLPARLEIAHAWAAPAVLLVLAAVLAAIVALGRRPSPGV